MEIKHDNIIYYGIAFDKFEILDFTTDFFAGVRANYFNSGKLPQTDSAKQQLNRIAYEFNYELEKDIPAQWQLKRNSRIIQQSAIIDDCCYCIENYYESDFIYKKIYYDNQHNWLKTDYFSRDENAVVYTLINDFINGHQLIKMIKFDDNGEKVSFLFPKKNMPFDKNYSVLAYTNKGFLYFNSVPNKCSDNNQDFGFSFKSDDFLMTKPINGYSITNAEYLDCSFDEENQIDENEPCEDQPLFIQEDLQTNINMPSVEESIVEKITFAESEEIPDSVVSSGGENYNYYGDTLNGKRHGYGRTATSQGRTAYEGSYRDDKRNGFGSFYCKNGDINYVGNWNDNRRNGFGVGFRNTDFTAHIGKWNENIPDGIGARFDCDGNFMFLGEFVNGKKQGIGITYDEFAGFVVSKFKDDELISTHPLCDILPDTE